MIDSRILVGLLSVLIAISGVVYIGINEADRQAEFTKAFQGRSIEAGAGLFSQYCVECHGIKGEGGIGPTLNSKYFFEQRLADLGYQGTMRAYLTLTIRGGRPVKSDPAFGRNMPTWSVDYGGPMRNDEIDTIVSYILNWEEGAPDLGDPNAEPTPVPGDTPEERGKNLFTGMGCIGCHTFDGQGGAVGPNLTTVYADKGEEYIRQSILQPNAVIAEGFAANVMPPNFEQRLKGPTDLDDILAYLATGGQ